MFTNSIKSDKSNLSYFSIPDQSNLSQGDGNPLNNNDNTLTTNGSTSSTKSDTVKKLTFVSILVLVISMVVSYFTVTLGIRTPKKYVETFYPSQSQLIQPTQSEIRKVLSGVLPSVASISVLSSPGGTPVEEGSGVVVSSTGELITNDHVIQGGSYFQATLANNPKSYSLKVLGEDPKDDLALLQLPTGNYQAITAAPNSALTVGNYVLAIGNALALGPSPSVTEGIISALGRQISVQNDVSGGQENLTDMIQTDAAINPGNSGGPLVDMEGQVVGINTATASSTPAGQPVENIGFAIPFTKVQALIPQLSQGGPHGQGAYLGVSLADLTPTTRLYFGIPDSVTYGAVVTNVVPSSPADQAGLQIGDVIQSIGGKPVQNAADVSLILSSLQPNQTALILVNRSGIIFLIPVQLGTKPSGLSS